MAFRRRIPTRCLRGKTAATLALPLLCNLAVLGFKSEVLRNLTIFGGAGSSEMSILTQTMDARSRSLISGMTALIDGPAGKLLTLGPGGAAHVERARGARSIIKRLIDRLKSFDQVLVGEEQV